MEEKARAEDLLGASGPPGKTGGSSPSAPSERPKSRFRRALPYLGVGFAVLFSLIELAGVLLRDRLEGRTLTSPAELVLSLADKAAPSRHESAEGGGVGFGVTEIPVGAVPSEATQVSTVHSGAGLAEHGGQAAPAATPEAHGEVADGHGEKPKETPAPVKAATPVKAAPERKAAPAKTEAKPKPEAKQKAAPPAKAEAKTPVKAETKAPAPAKAEAPVHEEAAPAKQPPQAKAAEAGRTQGLRFKADPQGGYAVAVGAFNSQRLAGLVEKKLDALGFPHVRNVVMKDADGFTLTVSAASDAVIAKAAGALTDAGYRAEKADSALTLRFISQEEAEKAKAVAEKAGAEGAVTKAVGQIPLWRVLAGPTTAENARKAQDVLKTEGMDCVVVRYRP